MADLEIIGARLVLQDFEDFQSKLKKVNDSVLNFGNTSDKAATTFSKGFTRVGVSATDASHGVQILDKATVAAILNQNKLAIAAEKLQLAQEKTAKAHAQTEDAQTKSSTSAVKLQQAQLDLSEAFKKVNEPAIKLDEIFAKVNKAVIEASGNFLKFGGEASRAVFEGLEHVGKGAFDATAKIVDLALGVAKAGAGIATNFVKSSVDAYNEFEAKLTEVKAVSDDMTAGQMKSLTDLAIDMGKRLPISATDAAASFVELAKAGVSTDDILFKIKDSLANLAVAGQMPMADATSVLVNTLSEFHLGTDQATHVVDVLAKTANSSTADLKDLAVTLKYSGSTAFAAGTPIEDLSVAMGLMANAGVKGSNSGTALRSILTRLVSPPKDAAGALKALGFSMTDASGNIKPLGQAIEELRPKFAGLTQEQRVSFATAIAGKPAMGGFLALIQSTPQAYADMTAAIKKADGASADLAKTITTSNKGSIESLGGTINTFQVAFAAGFQEPFKQAVGGVNDLIGALTPFADVMGKQVGTALQFAANGLAAFAQGASGKKGDASLSGFQKVLFDLGSGLTTQVIPAISKLANTFTSEVLPSVAQLVPVVAGLVSQLVSGAMPIFKDLSGIFQRDIMPVIKDFGGLLTNTIIPAVMSVVNTVVSSFSPVIRTAAQVLRENIFPAIDQMVKTALPPFLNIIKNVADFIKDPVLPTLGKMAEIFLSQVVPTVVKVADIFITALKPPLTEVFNFVNTNLLPKFQEFMAWFQKDGIPVVKSAADVIGGALSFAIKGLGPIISFSFDVATTSTKIFFGIIGPVLDFLKDAPGKAKSAFESMGRGISAAFDAVISIPGQLLDLGKNAINSLLQGIADGVKNIGSTIGSVPGSILDFFKNALGIHSPSTVFREQGDYIIQGLGQGLANTQQLQSVFREMAGQLQEYGRFAVDGSKAIGNAMAIGMASGFINSSPMIVDAAQRAARAALDAAKTTLGVHSPSTAFMEVGANVALGFSKGIIQTAPVAQTSMTKLVTMPATYTQMMSRVNTSTTYDSRQTNYNLNMQTMQSAGNVAKDFQTLRLLAA